MANTSTVNDLARPLRRSTRIHQGVPLVVMGVDSYRGPYREEVATVSISSHGCKYESKHDVLTNSWVMLEIKSQSDDVPPIRTRGLVKWVQRAVDSGGVQQTAIELEDPGNIWGIENAPPDWLPYTGPREHEEGEEAKPKPFALKRIETASTIVHDSYESAPGFSPVGQLMGDLQRQMEQTLFAAASSAVRERSAAALDEVRVRMREEANRIVAEAAALQSKVWVEQFTRQMKQSGAENAQEMHAEWEQKIHGDLESAGSKIDQKSRELAEQAEKLSTSAIERVQRGLEASHKDTVNRIVERLKAQVAPVVEEARKAAAELNKSREEIEQAIAQSGERAAARIDEVCVRVEKQFETMAAKLIESAGEEINRSADAATSLAMGNLDLVSKHQASEAKARFLAVLEPVAEAKLKAIQEKAEEVSRQFTDELTNHSRSHLEFVGSAISGFAKAMGKPQKD